MRARITTRGWLEGHEVPAPLPIREVQQGQPLVEANLPIFWIVLGATLLRVAADGYGFVLLALNRDRAPAR